MPVLSTIGASTARGFGWLFRAAGAPGAGLYAWGYNLNGQLGLGDTTNRSSPVQVGTATTWVKVSTTVHTLAIQSNGSLWAWGSGGGGRLGDGTAVTKSSPVQIGAGTNWNSAQTKFFHSLALKTDGTLWAWGDGALGALGDGTEVNKSSPVQIGALTSWTSVSQGSGQFTSHAVRSGGTLWAWGYAAESQNDAYGTKIGVPFAGANGINRSSPVQVSSGITWSNQIASGAAHALVLTTGGALYAWGKNTLYECGKTDTNNPFFCTVSPSYGVCGDSGAEYDAYYTQCISLGNYTYVYDEYNNCVAPDIYNTQTNTYAANTYLWGFSSPVQVGSDTNWARVAAGVSTSGAIKTTGTLWMWGANGNGECGTGDVTTAKSVPTQVGALTNWAFVKCGGAHTLAVKTDGTLWAWGANGSAQLGNGNVNTFSPRSSPVQVGSATNWLQSLDALSAGLSNSLAIRS